jgi:hypothetical protein
MQDCCVRELPQYVTLLITAKDLLTMQNPVHKLHMTYMYESQNLAP